MDQSPDYKELYLGEQRRRETVLRQVSHLVTVRISWNWAGAWFVQVAIPRLLSG
jgi:hypothetical protein